MNPDPAKLRDAISGDGQAPAQVAASTTTMPALTAAGVDLAKRTMIMIGVAILLLVALLMLTECAASESRKRLSEKQTAMIAAVSIQKPDPELRKLAAALDRTADEPKTALPSNTTILLDRIAQSELADPTQIAALDKCKIPETDAKLRSQSLHACADVVESLSRGDNAGAQRATLMAKLLDAELAERGASRAFWMQIAQLVLINLLLPILTALLGYIFGTQQSTASNG